MTKPPIVDPKALDGPPSRLHSLMIPDDLWEDVQDVARDEGRRLGTYVTASDVMRDGAIREVRRLRKRLEEQKT